METTSSFKNISGTSKKIWEKIFAVSNADVEMNKKLTHKILSDPNHKFVKTILYIYTMSSFIFSEMNRACR